MEYLIPQELYNMQMQLQGFERTPGQIERDKYAVRLKIRKRISKFIKTKTYWNGEK